MATGRTRAAGGPGVLLVTAVAFAAAAVATDAALELPAGLRAVLFCAWAAAVGVLGWGSLGRPVSRRGEAWLAGGGAVVAFGLLVLFLPGGVRAGRLAPPWSAPPAAVRLSVTTGDPVVPRGAGVTVACVFERLSADAPTVRLEVRDDAGQVRSVDPTEGPPGVLSARLPPVSEPLAYRFVGGPALTAWHHVTPADPVRLSDPSELVATPPDYAAGQYPVQRFRPTDGLACLTGGRLEAALAFDRPAADVRVWWQPDEDGPALSVPAALAADHLTATLAVPVSASGRLLLILTGDHGLRTEHVLPVTAVLDHPPEIITLTGLDAGNWAVRPDERLALTVEVADDVWAVAPSLVLLIGESPRTATAVPVPLTRLGAGRYAGQLVLPLADRWSTDRLVAKLRLADALRPGGVTAPADGWATFERSESATLLVEQIVLAQRDRTAAVLSGGADVERLRRLAADLRPVAELGPLADRLATLRADGDLAAVQELNRALAVERLDRVRLRELAGAVRLLAARPPADTKAVTERLAAVVAGSPRLTAARAAAERQSLADAVALAGRLADEMEAAARRVTADRAASLRPLADRINELAARTAEAEGRWAVAARLAGGGSPTAARLRQASGLLGDARPADALPVLDAAARQLADQGAAFAREAEARGDPREAGRQLVRWQADQAARPGPVAFEELGAWLSAALELAAVARAHHPTGGDTPERIARDFPPPAELKRRAVHDLREWLAHLDGTRPPDELAQRLDTLPPPVEGRASRVAAAVARRGQVAELRWRLDFLVRGEASPAALLDEPASQRTAERLAVLALRVGVPPDLGGDPDALAAAVRARLDGTDTDRRRLDDLVRWWTSRPAVDGSHVRDLLAVLAGVHAGDAAEVRRLAMTPRRPPGFQAEVATAVRKLRDGLGPEADASLASTAGLDRPTVAQRLVGLDGGGRLPSHKLAADARRLAADVTAAAKDTAQASAALHATNRVQPVRAEFAAAVAVLDGTFRKPGEWADRWAAVRQVWDAASDLPDTLRRTAAAARQLTGATRPHPTDNRAEVTLGRRLIEAEAALTEPGVWATRMRTATAALDAAAR